MVLVELISWLFALILLLWRLHKDKIARLALVSSQTFDLFICISYRHSDMAYIFSFDSFIHSINRLIIMKRKKLN